MDTGAGSAGAPYDNLKNVFMESKIVGIILCILGITGLILSLVYMNGAVNTEHVNIVFACGIAGTILFFAGIRLIPNGRMQNDRVPVNQRSEPIKAKP